MTSPTYNTAFVVDAQNLTRFVSNATGATWTLTNTATVDLLAHLVIITNDSVTDHSAKTAVITGTDAQGIALTETVNLPVGSGTTTSTKHFKTVTTVVPSATIGADTMDVGITAVAVSKWVKVDSSKDVGVGMDIGGTVNFDVQVCFADPATGESSAYIHTTFTGKTVDTYGVVARPVNAVRAKINSHTSGTFTLQVLEQARG